jgi:hypothetical protein
MRPEAGVGFDGSWSHVRRAPKCFGCFIDLLTRRVVDFEFFFPEPGGLGGAVHVATQSMEGVIFRALAEKWRHTGRVATLAHDQDAGISGTVRDLELDVFEMLDRSHVAKSFDTKSKSYSFVPGQCVVGWLPVMREIEHGVKTWFYSCLTMDEEEVDVRTEEVDVRTAKWLGATKHYIESGWSGNDDPDAVRLLGEFVRVAVSLHLSP